MTLRELLDELKEMEADNSEWLDSDLATYNEATDEFNILQSFEIFVGDDVLNDGQPYLSTTFD